MKIKSILIALLLFATAFTTSGQVNMNDMSFNYQGIYRDASGKVGSNTTITTIRVSYFKSSTITGSPDVVEEFSSVKTDQFGLFTLKLGTGTSKSTALFKDINWSVEQYFIQIKINGTALTTDPVPLNAVPYAKVAGKVVWSDYAILEERQPGGTDAGGNSAKSWSTRNLNTATELTGTAITFDKSKHQFTLSKGKYLVEGWTISYRSDATTSMVFNATDNNPAIIGATGYTNSAYYTHELVPFKGIITVAGSSKTFEIQIYTENSNSSGNGLGGNTNAPDKSGSSAKKDELYSQVFIQKID